VCQDITMGAQYLKGNFEMIRVVSVSCDGIYGKSENALFRHLGKEFTDLKINPEMF
jgi:hypothetical protein